MIKRLKVYFIALAIIFSFGTVLAPAAADAATPRDAACDGLALTGGACDDPNADPNDPNSSRSQLNRVIGTAINIFSLIVGVTSVIMIIIGGFKYIISMGDSASTASAKNTILYAVIGLVIVAMAQVIVRFVLDQV